MRDWGIGHGALGMERILLDIEQIPLSSNTRDVALLRLYKERGFIYVLHLPQICCI